jgi:hypothetical protein
MTVVHDPSDGVNAVFRAHSRLRRRRFDDTIQLCTQLLEKNKLDQQAWFLKVRATTLKNWVDDTELEEEGAISDAHALGWRPTQAGERTADTNLY